MLAAQCGNADIAMAALKAFADPNCRLLCGNRASALHIACAGGSPEVVQLLCDARASLLAEDAEGDIPLDAALRANSMHAVAKLLMTRSTKLLAALDARTTRWVGALRALLQSAPRAPTDASMQSGTFTDSSARALEAVKGLLRAMVQEHGKLGDTPSCSGLVKRRELNRALFLCVVRDWTGGLEALLGGLSERHSIRRDLRDVRSDRTPLEFADAISFPATAPETPEVAQVLQFHGFSDSVSSRNGFFAEWALQLAVVQNDLRAVAYWLRKSSDVDWREPPTLPDAQGGLRCTPLMLASLEGHLEAVQMLLESRAKPWLLDAEGRNAGMLARLRGHDRIADLLEGLASAYADRKLYELKTEAAKKDFIKSLMPSKWQFPRGWNRAAAEEGEDEQQLDEEFVAVDPTCLRVTLRGVTGLATDFFQWSTNPCALLELQRFESRASNFLGHFRRLQKQRSTVQHGTDAEWNESFEFTMEPSDALVVVIVDVDSEGGDPSEDLNPLGRIEILMEKWLPQLSAGKIVDIDRQLSHQIGAKESGRVQLSMCFKRL